MSIAGTLQDSVNIRYVFTISGTPTTVSGADDNSRTLAYTEGQADVYLNGVKQVVGTDVTATSGSSVVFASALTNNDIVEVVAFDTFQAANIDAGAITSGTLNTARIADDSITNDKLDNPGRRNLIINGDMTIAQRATSFTSGSNNNDAYTLDRFYILSDGNDIIDVTQSTEVPSTALNSIALDVETVNKKFGIAQIIENKNCTGLIGNTVTLSFEAKVSATTKLDNVKAAIVAWDGTADSVTSDIISAWGAEDTNPTLIANATYENTPANLNVTTSWAKYSVSGTVDTSGAKNIIVFIWSDVTDTTAGDFLYITNVQLELGSTASDFEHKSFGEELVLCQRYYTNVTHQQWCGAVYTPNGDTRAQVLPIGTMRASPTISPSSYSNHSINLGDKGFTVNGPTATWNLSVVHAGNNYYAIDTNQNGAVTYASADYVAIVGPHGAGTITCDAEL